MIPVVSEYDACVELAVGSGRVALAVEIACEHLTDARHQLKRRLRLIADLDGATIRLWWATRSEWEGLVDVAGLEIEAQYGWFDKRPPADDSPELVFVTRKP